MISDKSGVRCKEFYEFWNVYGLFAERVNGSEKPDELLAYILQAPDRLILLADTRMIMSDDFLGCINLHSTLLYEIIHHTDFLDV